MEQNVKKAEIGDWVKIEFTGTLEDGSEFDATPPNSPLEFQVGSGIILSHFEQSVVGMTEDEEKICIIKPQDGFGPRDETLLSTIQKNELPEEYRDAVPGQIIPLLTEDDDKFPGIVLENNTDTLSIDMNHPLAGESLEFKVKLLAINTAPSES